MSRKKRNKKKKRDTVRRQKSVIRLNDRRILIEAYPPRVVIQRSQGVSNEYQDANLNRHPFYGGGEAHALRFQSAVSEPPKHAQRLLSLFLRLDEREAAIGDLVETYQRKVRQFGKRCADRWVYRQVARSILPLLLRLIAKIGWLILGEWIKKHVS